MLALWESSATLSQICTAIMSWTMGTIVGLWTHAYSDGLNYCI